MLSFDVIMDGSRGVVDPVSLGGGYDESNVTYYRWLAIFRAGDIGYNFTIVALYTIFVVSGMVFCPLVATFA